MEKNLFENKVENRFWEKVSFIGSRTYCWEWVGSSLPKGYGLIHINKKVMSAHRVSWEMYYGPIPVGMYVLHRCDNPCCVRPDHLFLGTNKDNMEDKVKKGRQPKPKGESNGRAKLTEKQVKEIRANSEGLSYKALGEKFLISPQQISSIMRNKRWSHV